MTIFKNVKNNSQKNSNTKFIEPLENKNHILTLSFYDNKDGTIHGQFLATTAYFDNDAKKLNRIISNIAETIKSQLAKENVILIHTLH